MKKHLIIVITVIIIITVIPQSVFSQENNKIGISLLQPTSDDISAASEMINANGGDFGYVTLVIQETDRDVRKWQDLFEQLREKHLIPIIRLATSPQGEVWRRPEEKDARAWVEFLNKLNWVVKKRYITLFNEPNHASEWGGEVDPAGYGKVALAFAKALKESNNDYIVMPAGLDAAAPSYLPQFEDSGIFIKKIFAINYSLPPTTYSLINYIDAWSSHSYPNPGFSGSVWDVSKKSIRGYEYELNVLKELGVAKDLPVFITETGWKEGALSDIAISENIYTAYTQVWNKDGRIQAVTPFVFSYLSEPFLGFSWKKPSGYSVQYNVVKELQKIKGVPEQMQKGAIHVSFPSTLIAKSTYHFSAYIKNEGQAIWSSEDGYTLVLKTDSREMNALLSDVHKTKPLEEGKMSITIKTPAKPQTVQFFLQLKRGDIVIMETKKVSIRIEPFPELTIKTSIFPKLVANGEGFEVQLFNIDEELVFSKKGLTMRKGVIEIQDISDVIPGEWYRVVLLGYPYIPRQEITVLNKGKNTVNLKRLLPLDADGNGRMDFNDVKEALLKPGFFQEFNPFL